MTKKRKEKSPSALVPADPPPELIDVGAGLGEVGLDVILDDGALRDVPVLGSAVGLARATRTIRDRLFLRKVARFFRVMNEADEWERARFAESLGEDPKERARAGENLLLLLERLDDTRKPGMIGRIYLAFLRGRVDLRTLRLLTDAIDRLQLTYVDDFRSFYTLGETPSDDALALQHLGICGLLTVNLGRGTYGGGGGSYSRSALGQTLQELGVLDA